MQRTRATTLCLVISKFLSMPHDFDLLYRLHPLSRCIDLLCSSANNPKALEEDLFNTMRINVVANVNLFNLYLPAIRKGQLKKVVYISTGMVDVDLISRFSVAAGPIYAMTKAAGTVAVSKFHAQYGKEGILFMSISPGFVLTSQKNSKSRSPRVHSSKLLSKSNWVEIQ
jgi:short-subunit dehydrogenase involved in D-alanine esterification of teichoic acids